MYDPSTSISSPGFYWVLFGELPQVGIRDGAGPVYSQEASEAPGGGGLQLVEYGAGNSPGL